MKREVGLAVVNVDESVVHAVRHRCRVVAENDVLELAELALDIMVVLTGKEVGAEIETCRMSTLGESPYIREELVFLIGKMLFDRADIVVKILDYNRIDVSVDRVESGNEVGADVGEFVGEIVVVGAEEEIGHAHGICAGKTLAVNLTREDEIDHEDKKVCAYARATAKLGDGVISETERKRKTAEDREHFIVGLNEV